MTEITINFTYIFAVMYAVAKAAASVWICKREFLYPIWNSEGIQVNRGLHHKIQSFLRNWAINPEWGLLKAIAFAPVFLATGKRFIHAFMPWRVQKAPPFCQRCKDKGRYHVNSFYAGKTGWQSCECQNKTTPELKPENSCHVCLDQKTIGKNRPCPHCERRLMFVRHAQSELNRSQIKDPERCAGCGVLTELKELSLVGEDSTSRWFCRMCLGQEKLDGAQVRWFSAMTQVKKNRIVDIDIQPDSVKRHICGRCGFSYVLLDGTYGTKSDQYVCSECYNKHDDPLRYLKGKPCFCGDPNDVVEVEDKSRFHGNSLCGKQPSELQVGDTIVVRTCNRGHRNGNLIGKSLHILGLNLPFAAIEHDMYDDSRDDRRYVEVIDLRGMTLYGNRIRSPRSSIGNAYQPLLNPTALRVGDSFVVLRIHEKGTDGSYRGEAFRVTKPAHRLGSNGTLVLECENLSFSGTFSGRLDSPISMTCEGLQIITVNDQYIQATNVHCPDIV